MPTFFKRTRKTSLKSRSRKFMVRSTKKSVPVHSAKKNKSTAPQRTTAETLVTQVPYDNQGTLKQHADITLNALDQLLSSTQENTAPVDEHKDPDTDNAVYHDDNEVKEFNGISDTEERNDIFGQVRDYEARKDRAMAEQIKLLEKEKEEEKKVLQREIRALKEELHRTVPIQENKFFTLSKELRGAIEEIEHLAADSGLADESTVPQKAVSNNLTPSPVSQSVKIPTANLPVTSPPPQPKIPVMPDKSSSVEKKGGNKKKLLLTGAGAVAGVTMISVVMSGTLTGKAKVDQKLVDHYLEAQTGQVQGAETSALKPAGESDPSQADVNFENSVWEDYKDASFGIMLQYPKNAVKSVRSDSNVTFIRKTGYIFKVQRVETALTPQEYWKQIQATSLNFEVTEDKFKGKPALKLELKDVTDYPGDRYLVKEGKYIYDIWYATPSNNFAQDDIKRAEKMLASLSIISVE